MYVSLASSRVISRLVEKKAIRTVILFASVQCINTSIERTHSWNVTASAAHTKLVERIRNKNVTRVIIERYTISTG